MGRQKVDVTIFHLESDNTWTKHVYHDCFWEVNQVARTNKSGLASADSLYISIPWQNEPLVINKGKDIAIKGTVEETIDNTTSATVSATLKAMKASHETFTITSMATLDHGSRRMWHYELSGK